MKTKLLAKTLPARVAFAAAFVFAVASAPAGATVIYNGGAPDQGGQIYATGTASVAMSFTLAPGADVVTDAHWWGGCFPSTTCGSTPNFTLGINADSGGLPGANIWFGNVGSANQTLTGKVIGPPTAPQWDEYSYSATFAPLTLTPGTTYWFALRQNDVASPTWGAETTSTAPLGSTSASYGSFGLSWTALPEKNLAFELTGGVPEPATWAMVLLGFATVGFAGYRGAKATLDS